MMHHFARRTLLLVAFALLATALTVHAHVAVVRAAQTWTVQTGGDPGPVPAPASGNFTLMGFFPTVLTIDSGDTVNWTFPSALDPHGVAFDNGQQPPVASQVNPGPGEGEADLSATFLPLNLDKIQGVFNPSIQFASGVSTDPPDQRTPFTLTFKTPGVWRYNCQIHGDSMTAWVVVEPAGAALPETPAQATARGQSDIGAMVGQVSGGPAPEAAPPTTLPDGRTLPAVQVGGQVATQLSALGFLPGDLTVHRGDTVLFSAGDPAEIHTVTFLSGAPPPPFVDVRPQPSGPPQIVFPANVAGPVGGNTYTGSGYLNSGILFPSSTFAVTFDAPAGTYAYLCLIHEGMTGTITVQ